MAIPILGNIDVKGQILVDGGTGYGQLEIGGNSGGIIDLKAPNSDDYDLRITASASAHELTTASGTLKLNTGNTLAMTVESDQKVTFEKDIRTKEDLKVDGIIHLRNDGAEATTYGPYISGTNTSLQFDYDGNSSGTAEFWSHNQNGGAAVRVLKLPNMDGDSLVEIGSTSQDADLHIYGDFSFQGQGATTITHSSGVFAIDFDVKTNYYICTVVNESFVDHSISFSNIASNVGQSGTIIINNPNVVSTNFISWDDPALPNTAYTPGGSAITFGSGSNGIAVMTYFIATSTIVLINYVSGFASYPQ